MSLPSIIEISRYRINVETSLQTQSRYSSSKKGVVNDHSLDCELKCECSRAIVSDPLIGKEGGRLTSLNPNKRLASDEISTCREKTEAFEKEIGSCEEEMC